MAAATDRTEAATRAAADGAKAPPLRRLRDVVRSESSLAEYLDWSASPFGRLAVGALRDLALWGPVAVQATDVAVQYGVSIGLSLAARLLEDPSAVMPPEREERKLPDMNFAVSPSDALDSM